MGFEFNLVKDKALTIALDTIDSLLYGILNWASAIIEVFSSSLGELFATLLQVDWLPDIVRVIFGWLISILPDIVTHTTLFTFVFSSSVIFYVSFQFVKWVKDLWG